MCLRRALLGLLFVPLSALLGSQTSSTTGTLMLTVRDISGAVIPGAAVVVRDKATNQAWQTLSAEDGTSRFVALPAGDYEIRSDVAGFTPYVNRTLIIPLG